MVLKLFFSINFHIVVHTSHMIFMSHTCYVAQPCIFNSHISATRSVVLLSTPCLLDSPYCFHVGCITWGVSYPFVSWELNVGYKLLTLFRFSCFSKNSSYMELCVSSCVKPEAVWLWLFHFQCPIGGFRWRQPSNLFPETHIPEVSAGWVWPKEIVPLEVAKC